ncbi:MAG TPA: HAMP domain-containing sensor histidine kinase [Kofleriaceae bacterium]|nr:HAMP domain-containing sensor histidine kinase [Kofleriaceae bacterium]
MLHELLTRFRDEIMIRCERKLRARHPQRPAEEVVDTIPLFIDELIKAERREGGFAEDTPLPVHVPHAKEHGAQRYHNGFDISEIAMDFGSISDTIGEIAIEQDFYLDPRSYKLLNECIDKAIAESLEQYFALDRASHEEGVAVWIGSLGHELRNALGSALMAYNVLKAGTVGTASRTARVLERSLQRLHVLITETLATVQLRGGKQLFRQKLYLHELLDDIIQAIPNDRRVSIHNLVEQALYIEADATLLESALSNLILNAVKFTRPGGHVDVRAVAMQGATLLEIEDECGGLGTGNPDELFTPFFQTNPGRGGVGLGLAITREAVAAHGGDITVRDLAPKGCVFVVRLPQPSP